MWDKRYLRTEFHKSGISFFPARRIWSHRIIYPRSTKSNCRNDFCLLWGIVQQSFVCMIFFNGSTLSSEMLQNVGFLEWSNCKVQIASVLVWVSRCFIKVHFTGIITTTSVNRPHGTIGSLSDSRSEGCVFQSNCGQMSFWIFFVICTFCVLGIVKSNTASNER